MSNNIKQLFSACCFLLIYLREKERHLSTSLCPVFKSRAMWLAQADTLFAHSNCQSRMRGIHHVQVNSFSCSFHSVAGLYYSMCPFSVWHLSVFWAIVKTKLNWSPYKSHDVLMSVSYILQPWITSSSPVWSLAMASKPQPRLGFSDMAGLIIWRYGVVGERKEKLL